MTDILTDIENYAERVAGGELKQIEAFEQNFVATDWPYIKAFFALLFQQETKDAVNAGIAAVNSLSTPPTVNGVLQAVGAAVTSSIVANAAADATTEIQDAEAAGVVP